MAPTTVSHQSSNRMALALLKSVLDKGEAPKRVDKGEASKMHCRVPNPLLATWRAKGTSNSICSLRGAEQPPFPLN